MTAETDEALRIEGMAWYAKTAEEYAFTGIPNADSTARCIAADIRAEIARRKVPDISLSSLHYARPDKGSLSGARALTDS